MDFFYSFFNNFVLNWKYVVSTRLFLIVSTFCNLTLCVCPWCYNRRWPRRSTLWSVLSRVWSWAAPCVRVCCRLISKTSLKLRFPIKIKVSKSTVISRRICTLKVGKLYLLPGNSICISVLLLALGYFLISVLYIEFVNI